MDLQFSMANFKETPEPCWPIKLREYKETIHESVLHGRSILWSYDQCRYIRLSVSSLNASGANLPLIFSDNGTTFVLKSSTLIRQSTDPLFHIDKKAQVVNESILDLNSNERYATCKVGGIWAYFD